MKSQVEANMLLRKKRAGAERVMMESREIREWCVIGNICYVIIEIYKFEILLTADSSKNVFSLKEKM